MISSGSADWLWGTPAAEVVAMLQSLALMLTLRCTCSFFGNLGPNGARRKAPLISQTWCVRMSVSGCAPTFPFIELQPERACTARHGVFKMSSLGKRKTGWSVANGEQLSAV